VKAIELHYWLLVRLPDASLMDYPSMSGYHSMWLVSEMQGCGLKLVSNDAGVITTQLHLIDILAV
jgi:hypothetical protein